MNYWKTIVLSVVTVLALTACGGSSSPATNTEWTDAIKDAQLYCDVSEVNISSNSITANVKCNDEDGITEASVRIKDNSDSMQHILLKDNSKSIDTDIVFNGLEENTTYTLQASVFSLNAKIDTIEKHDFETYITTKLLETPPIIGTLEDQLLENEEELNYTLPITQTDGDIATVEVLGLPTGFSYDDATRTITGSSTTAWTTEVTVEATDDDGTTTKSFRIIVNELENEAPTLNLNVTLDWTEWTMHSDTEYTQQTDDAIIFDATKSTDDWEIVKLIITSDLKWELYNWVNAVYKRLWIWHDYRWENEIITISVVDDKWKNTNKDITIHWK